MSGHQHSASCSHGSKGKSKVAVAAAQPRMTEQGDHGHSHGGGGGGHVHSAQCSHGKPQRPPEHVHSAQCSHGKPAAAAEHQHGAGCAHGHGHGHDGHGDESEGPAEPQHVQEDLSVPVYGGDLPECRTPEERAAVIEALPTPEIADLIGKVRELWRLGRLLFEQKSFAESLHLFAEAVRLGCRWLVVGEGPKYWGEIVYNVFYHLPSVDKVELAVYGSWAHWWIIQQCVQALQQQAPHLPREEVQLRIGDVRALQRRFEEQLEAVATNKALAANRSKEVSALWLALAVCHAHTRNAKDELRCANNAIASDPESAEAQLRCGTALLEAKKVSDATAYFDRAIALFPVGSPELMTAHLGAAFCRLGANAPSEVMHHARELRTLDLKHGPVANLRFAAVTRELAACWPPVLAELTRQLARGGVCGWCFKTDADKRCSACNAADYCSPECFRAAWKGDATIPAHKLSCKK